MLNIQKTLRHALMLCQTGQFLEAKVIYSKLIKTIPNNFEALTNLGTIELQLGNFEVGIKFLKKSISINPNQPHAISNLGNGLFESGLYKDAISYHDKAILINSSFASAYYNKGKALTKLNDFESAINCYNIAIEITPDYLMAHINLGFVLNQLQRYDEAIYQYNFAIQLEPNFSEAYYCLGVSLDKQKRHDDALANYERAIQLKPDYAEAYLNRGVTYNELQRYDDALANYERAIQLKPDYAEAYLNKSLLKILLGEYEEGWELYEWRWKDSQQKDLIRNFKQPLWLGEESIKDKSILIYTEQGFGDVIQFCRYVSIIDALTPKQIIFEVPKSLFSILSSLSSKFRLVEQGATIPDFDVHCPIMSLPHTFNTTVNTIPAAVPYLYADVRKTKLWNKKLGHKTKPRVGLVWSGSTTHKNDHNRSLLLRQLEQLLKLPFEFHSLQKEIRPIDLETLSEFKQIKQHQNELMDFSDTAALIENLDLVISVDTSVAHLAGALGKKVFILLPFAPDYRWMIGRIDSPWYPTATLFRQPSSFDWGSVLTDVVQELNQP